MTARLNACVVHICDLHPQHQRPGPGSRRRSAAGPGSRRLKKRGLGTRNGIVASTVTSLPSSAALDCSAAAHTTCRRKSRGSRNTTSAVRSGAERRSAADQEPHDEETSLRNLHDLQRATSERPATLAGEQLLHICDAKVFQPNATRETLCANDSSSANYVPRRPLSRDGDERLHRQPSATGSENP